MENSWTNETAREEASGSQDSVPLSKHPLSDDVPLEYRRDVEEIVHKMEEALDARSNQPKIWSLSDFQVGLPLGRGKFGRVFLAREKETGYLVAMKTLFKTEFIKLKMQHQVVREIEIQTHLQHPNILQLLNYFTDEKCIYLALEYAANGELFSHLQRAENGHFTEGKAAKYVSQVADALDYCHSMQVIHRDIKPENLLLDAHDNIKLADFGWSVHAPSNRRRTMCGTLEYLPPEMVQQKAYTSTVDNWCLGVLCYELLVGRPPFESPNQELTFKKITSLALEYPGHVGIHPRAFISSLLKKNPSERLPLGQVKSHEWISEVIKKPP